jgi:hypothetical protein
LARENMQASPAGFHCPPLLHMGRTARLVQEGPFLILLVERLKLSLLPHREAAMPLPENPLLGNKSCPPERTVKAALLKQAAGVIEESVP